MSTATASNSWSSRSGCRRPSCSMRWPWTFSAMPNSRPPRRRGEYRRVKGGSRPAAWRRQIGQIGKSANRQPGKAARRRGGAGRGGDAPLPKTA
eukprot:gene33257-41038_t